LSRVQQGSELQGEQLEKIELSYYRGKFRRRRFSRDPEDEDLVPQDEG
jgi:hypothetical protein